MSWFEHGHCACSSYASKNGARIFEWSAYPPGNELDFAGKLEFTVVMKNSLRAMIKSRV